MLAEHHVFHAHLVLEYRIDGKAESVAIGHAGDIYAGQCGELDEPPRSDVDFEEFEDAVAIVSFELGIEDTAVLQVLQQVASNT